MDFRSWVSMPMSSFTGVSSPGYARAYLTRAARSSTASLAAARLLAPERHDRRAGPRHEPPLLIHDVALDQPDRPPALHDAARGRELPRPHGSYEIDLQLERRERLARVERRRPGHPHRRVGDVTEHPAVNRPHRVGVALGRFELDDCGAWLDGD